MPISRAAEYVSTRIRATISHYFIGAMMPKAANPVRPHATIIEMAHPAAALGMNVGVAVFITSGAVIIIRCVFDLDL